MKIRKYNFNFDNVEKYWFGNDPFMTHFINSLSITFPDGEAFFKRAVKCHTTEELKDLEKDIKIFLAQESYHTKAHIDFNKMVENHGYPIPSLQKIAGDFLMLLENTTSKQFCLAVTCALEHLTALLAEVILTNENISKNIQNPEVLKLWKWHALEEIEHKSVAFDVYERTYGKNNFQAYFIRVLALIVATCSMVIGTTISQCVMHKIDGNQNVKTWLTGFSKLWYSPGYIRGKVFQYLKYFDPKFHPNQIDTNLK